MLNHDATRSACDAREAVYIDDDNSRRRTENCQ